MGLDGRILALVGHGDEWTFADIGQAVELDTTKEAERRQLHRALGRLMSAGQMVKSGRGRYGLGVASEPLGEARLRSR
jgi:hypothetical protein